MKGLKTLVLTLAIIAGTACTSLQTIAAGIGVVDINKVVDNYSKAQDVTADIKVKEAELQKFLADAQKQLKDAKTQLEKKNLEDKLSNEFQVKSQAFKDTQIKQWKEIEDNVFSAIDSISKSKKFDIVLHKTSVLTGGVDISDEVLNILNKK